MSVLYQSSSYHDHINIHLQLKGVLTISNDIFGEKQQPASPNRINI